MGKKPTKAGYFFDPQTLQETEPSSKERPVENVPSPAEAQERTKALLLKARGGK